MSSALLTRPNHPDESGWSWSLDHWSECYAQRHVELDIAGGIDVPANRPHTDRVRSDDHAEGIVADVSHPHVEHEVPNPQTGSSTDDAEGLLDRKSTRLNSSHVKISYAVFC